jgi:hypothetical protein
VPHGNGLVTVDDDATVLGALVADGTLDMRALQRAGITAVVEWKTTPGTRPVVPAGLTKASAGPDFDVWAVSGDSQKSETGCGPNRNCR